MIRVAHLAKTYGDKVALRDVSFEVPPGQICGYIGPNGAGKSTTVKILTGTLRPTSGVAEVAGFSVQEQPLEVKRRIGYVPETGQMYQTLSVTEYLTLVGTLHDMPPAEIAQRSLQLLQLFCIGDVLHRRIDTLSKGMRQKVVLASALIHDPDVLLFDEPLSGLDANATQTVKGIVRKLADRGKTVLYCSHVLDVVERLCDRVMILDEGEVVADGSPAELMSATNRATLENVFRTLTSGEDQDAVAEQIVDVVSRRETP